MRVTLDLFSGRPNPSWRLCSAQVRALIERLPAWLEPEATTFGLGLGFRGFIIQREADDPPVPSTMPRRFRVAAPAAPAATGAGYFEDQVVGGPELARWLLETAVVVDDAVLAVAAEHLGGEPTVRAPGPVRVQTARAKGARTRAARARQSSVETRAADAALPAQTFLSPYRPEFWNIDSVQSRNNCYNYATNFISNTVAQPGRQSGQMYDGFECGRVVAAAVNDGYRQTLEGVARVVALAIWPGLDFHWWRLHPEGMWAHKLGLSTARNFDNAGHVIANGLTPETCERLPYTDFCGYFYVPLSVRVL